MNYIEFAPKEIKITTKNGYPKGWDHQYNGVACSQTTIYKKLATLGFSDSKYFNLSWWYYLSYQVDKDGEPFVIENVDWTKMGFPGSKAECKEQEQKLANRPGKIYHTQLAQLIEAELNKLNSAYSNFRIKGELTEAYLEVNFEYRGKYQNGFVVWENCD